MTKTQTPADFRTPGTKVAGTYMGNPFTGTVTSSRWHTMNHETTMVFVELDEAIEVRFAGQVLRKATDVLVHVYFDGSNADSYNGVGHGDSIRAS